MANINDFKAKLAGGGARANQFKVTMPFPGYASVGGEIEDFAFLCKATSLPAMNIGNIDVIKKLKLVSKLYCVYGNIDGNEIRSECNEFEFLKIEKSKIILTHIAGKTPYYNKKTINKISNKSFFNN